MPGETRSSRIPASGALGWSSTRCCGKGSSAAVPQNRRARPPRWSPAVAAPSGVLRASGRLRVGSPLPKGAAIAATRGRGDGWSGRRGPGGLKPQGMFPASVDSAHHLTVSFFEFICEGYLRERLVYRPTSRVRNTTWVCGSRMFLGTDSAFRIGTRGGMRPSSSARRSMGGLSGRSCLPWGTC